MCDTDIFMNTAKNTKQETISAAASSKVGFVYVGGAQIRTWKMSSKEL